MRCSIHRENVVLVLVDLVCKYKDDWMEFL